MSINVVAGGTPAWLLVVAEAAASGAYIGLVLIALGRRVHRRSAAARRVVDELHLPAALLAPGGLVTGFAALGALLAAAMFLGARIWGHPVRPSAALGALLVAAMAAGLVAIIADHEHKRDRLDLIVVGALGGALALIVSAAAAAFIHELATVVVCATIGALASRAWPVLALVWRWWLVAYMRTRRLVALAGGTLIGISAGLGLLLSGAPRTPWWLVTLAVVHPPLWSSAARPRLASVARARLDGSGVQCLTLPPGRGLLGALTRATWGGFLLLHGVNSSARDSWGGGLEELRLRNLGPAYAPDLPGGIDPAAPALRRDSDNHGIATLADAIEAVVGEIGHRITIVGHSQGAAAATEYLARGNAPLVTWFVAVCPAWVTKRWTGIVRPRVAAAVEALARRAPRVVRRVGPFFAGGRDRQRRQEFGRRLAPPGAVHLIANGTVRMVLELRDRVFDLAGIRVTRPPLVVVNQADGFVDGAAVTRLAEGAGFEVMPWPWPGDGHSVHKMRPGAFWDAVLGVRARAPGAAGRPRTRRAPSATADERARRSTTAPPDPRPSPDRPPTAPPKASRDAREPRPTVGRESETGREGTR